MWLNLFLRKKKVLNINKKKLDINKKKSFTCKIIYVWVK